MAIFQNKFPKFGEFFFWDKREYLKDFLFLKNRHNPKQNKTKLLIISSSTGILHGNSS
jgi:hypothetical protein